MPRRGGKDDDGLPSSVETVRVCPALEGLFSIQQEDLHALVLDIKVVARGRSPLFRQRRVNAPRNVQNHGAWSRTIGGTNEAFRGVFAVVMGDQGQSRHIALGAAGGVAGRNQVDKGHLLSAAHRRRRRRVVELNAPLRQLRLEEVDEVLAHGAVALGPGHTGSQNRRQQRAFVDVKVAAGARQLLERVVAEVVVSRPEGW